jgi:hypothetical protein
MKAGQQAATLWNSGQKVWTTARSWMKGWGGSSTIVGQGDVVEAGASGEKMLDEAPVGLPVDAPPPPLPEDGEGHQHEIQEDEDEEAEGEGEPQKRRSLWGPCECCISCVSFPYFKLNLGDKLTKQLVTEYFNHENFEGVGQG